MKININKAFLMTAFFVLLFSFIFVSQSRAGEYNPRITNLAGGQFTVSWITKISCTGKAKLYKDSSVVGDFFDDRGKDFKGFTHYITVKGLKENTVYAFSLESCNNTDNNNGLFYQATTGPNLIPVGSIQPAGKVFLNDKLTPATGSIVYITAFNKKGVSAPLSTLVDENGYWYIELVNARDEDNQMIYNLNNEDCKLIISAEGNTGSASLEAPVMDSEGGTKLYETLILGKTFY